MVQRGLCKLGDVFKLVKRKAVPALIFVGYLEAVDKSSSLESRRAYSAGGGLGVRLNIVTTSELAGGGGANNPNLTFAGSGSTLP